KQTRWASDLTGVTGAPGGGNPQFYEATQPSVSSDGHFVAFAARPANDSIAVPPGSGIPNLTAPSTGTSAPQAAADEQLTLEDWSPGQRLTVQVTDADGACGQFAGDSIAFAGTPILTVTPPGPAVSASLAPSGSGCGTNQVVLAFGNGGTGSETI